MIFLTHFLNYLLGAVGNTLHCKKKTSVLSHFQFESLKPYILETCPINIILFQVFSKIGHFLRNSYVRQQLFDKFFAVFSMLDLLEHSSNTSNSVILNYFVSLYLIFLKIFANAYTLSAAILIRILSDEEIHWTQEIIIY